MISAGLAAGSYATVDAREEHDNGPRATRVLRAQVLANVDMRALELQLEFSWERIRWDTAHGRVRRMLLRILLLRILLLCLASLASSAASSS